MSTTSNLHNLIDDPGVQLDINPDTDKRLVSKMSIVQIVPPHKWGGCLAVVDELKSFGIQAYVSIPSNDGQVPSSAFIRLAWDAFEPVGAKAIFAPSSISFDVEQEK